MNLLLPAQVADRLREPLPGWAAQARFQPELSFGRHMGPPPATARQAAVLILLYPRADSWHVPLTLRPATMADHASQVSLPGGVIEPGESSGQAALREYEEELGTGSSDVRLLGRLSEIYLFASNYRIAPWVAVSEATPQFQPNPGEVQRLLEIPLTHFLDSANIGSVVRRQRGLDFRAPCYQWQTERIWGATSMILSEFVSSLTNLAP